MSNTSPNTRLLANFWSLPVLLTAVGVALLALLLWADHAGASAALADAGWPWAVAGDTVLETASTATTVVVTLVSLFFSITLIVLTIAASNLGVRLIERWVGQVEVRFTLSLLLALLAYAVLLQAAIDPDGPDAELPRLALTALLAALVPTLGWLAFAFDRLSRLIHVDTSIAGVGERLRLEVEALVAAAAPGGERAGERVPDRARPVAAPRSGYLADLDLDALVRSGARVTLPAVGDHFLLAGEPVAWVGNGGDVERVRRALRLARHRREGAGAPFEVALLAEIAVRALSPALNDIYTALVAADRLVEGLAPGFASGRLDGWFGPTGGVHAPGLAARALLAEPLAIWRTAAAPQPVMALRLADALGRLADAAARPDDARWLHDRAAEVLDGALAETPTDPDARDLTAARDRLRAEATSPPA